MTKRAPNREPFFILRNKYKKEQMLVLIINLS